ncbi:uncharacterized protein [Onthophagus taurus]|uniref:uncharacterized protein n=1 Tax=Onthophagus taurus TaxID=166361 RepID=UPI0039BE8833
MLYNAHYATKYETHPTSTIYLLETLKYHHFNVMFIRDNSIISSPTTLGGGGGFNTLINKLPIELHVPGYQFCGPGTKLKKRLARGDTGINPLDRACREHDIAYSNSNTLDRRHEADKRLEENAWERVKAKDSTFGEKASAWMVTNVMKAKRKLGLGHKRRSRRQTKPKPPSTGVLKRKISKKKKRCEKENIIRGVEKGGALKYKSNKPLAFKRTLVNRIVKDLPKSTDNLREAAQLALKSARIAVKTVGGRKKIKIPRAIPLPIKRGGILPILPAIFAGLSALGALSGGTAGVYRAIKSGQEAKEKLEEAERHNKQMEAIAIGKSGNGLYIKKYKKGLGLYLSKKKKQKNL